MAKGHCGNHGLGDYIPRGRSSASDWREKLPPDNIINHTYGPSIPERWNPEKKAEAPQKEVRGPTQDEISALAGVYREQLASALYEGQADEKPVRWAAPAPWYFEGSAIHYTRPAAHAALDQVVKELETSQFQVKWEHASDDRFVLLISRSLIGEA